MPDEELRVSIKLKDFASQGMKKFVGVVDRAAAKVRSKLAAVKSTVFSLKGALVALGGVAIAKSFVTAGAELEKFRTQLVAVMDQNEQLADETLKWVRDFAAVTPHMTNDVVQAFVSLQAAGVNANKQMMETIGNVAYVFDRNIADVSLGLVSMEKEIFKRLGIQWEITGDKAKIWAGDTVVHTNKAAESMRKGILEIWAKKFPDAMKRAEGDFRGLTALLSSQWWEFRADVMKSGVMDFVKNGIRAASDLMGDMGTSAPKVADKIVHAMTMGASAIGMIAHGAKVAMISVLWLGKETLKAFEPMEKKAKRFLKEQDIKVKSPITGRMVSLMKERAVLDDVQLMEAEIASLRKDSYQDLVKQWLAQINLRNAAEERRKEAEKIQKVEAEMADRRKEMSRNAKKYASDPFAGMTPKINLDLEQERYKTILKEQQAYAEMVEDADKFQRKMTDNQVMDRYARIQGAIENIGGLLSDNIVRAIDAAVEGTFKWQQALQGLARDFARMATQQAMQALVKIASTAIAGAFSGGGASYGTGINQSASPYAKGGFVTGGIHLPRAAKGMTVKGETALIAGDNPTEEEYVMPAVRDAQGNLGVKASGGGGTVINNYITAMDSQDVMRVLTNNPDAVAAGVQKAKRNNPGFLGG